MFDLEEAHAVRQGRSFASQLSVINMCACEQCFASSPVFADYDTLYAFPASPECEEAECQGGKLCIGVGEGDQGGAIDRTIGRVNCQ